MIYNALIQSYGYSHGKKKEKEKSGKKKEKKKIQIKQSKCLCMSYYRLLIRLWREGSTADVYGSSMIFSNN